MKERNKQEVIFIYWQLKLFSFDLTLKSSKKNFQV